MEEQRQGSWQAASSGCIHRGNEARSGGTSPTVFFKCHQPHPDVVISNPLTETALLAYAGRREEGPGWGYPRWVGLDSLIHSGVKKLLKPSMENSDSGTWRPSLNLTSPWSPQNWQVLPFIRDRTMCQSGRLLGTIYMMLDS
jgi:hypothetical protein